MIMRKCSVHGYTLKNLCPDCDEETREAHYKFVKIKDVSEVGKKALGKRKRKN